MGIPWSSNKRRHNNNNHYHYPYPPPQLIPSSSSAPYPFLADPFPAHPPPPPCPYAHHQPPPPPPPPLYSSSYYHHSGACNYANPMMARPNFHPNYAYYNNGWAEIRPPPMVAQPLPPPPAYVEHQQAKKVRNDVNVHKDTLRLMVDEQNPDHHLVSFTFDALFDGSITIFYFAKEEANCRFVPVFPEAYVPVRIPFKKGLGQKFHQPSGTGIDLGFFELDDLSKPLPGPEVFPLVISAETYPPSLHVDEHFTEPLQYTSPHMQITQAVLEKNNGDPFKVKVILQILWIDGVRYELREIYGIGNSVEGFNDNDSGKDCVICMTEAKDTAVLPCRHMCMCSECAKALRLQSNKCPICRQPIEELMVININNVDQ